MNVIAKQISSLEKIRNGEISDVKPIWRKTIMKGECFSYQIALASLENIELSVDVTSPLKDYVKLYIVKNGAMDYIAPVDADDDFLVKETGLMPDILMPAELEKNIVRIANDALSLWITVKIPEDIEAGEYPVTVNITNSGNLYDKCKHTNIELNQTMVFDIINKVMPEQKTIFTQWFHVDCIASVHNVNVYSEEHWDLIDKYMQLANELGINMILTPVITPPLDTEVGAYRPCTQLVKIEKIDETYSFDFALLKRWIQLCQKNNIQYFEISHLFSQWGLKSAPGIKVTENGEESYMFGWHTDTKNDEYRSFLNQFIPSLIEFLKSEGVKEKCWFHISDEPHISDLSSYKYAYDIIKPLIDGCHTMDAISHYDFYEAGLIPNPVTATDDIEPFLEHKVKNQLAYYCSAQYKRVGNRFLAMPSYRNRILGLQLYKFNIVGFLHWGYNFYYSKLSRKVINPYLTTSADKAFPAGDAFSVYPINDGVIPSIRAVIFKEALNDIEICRTLEEYIGRDKVVEMIDEAAEMNLTFSEYPRNTEFIPDLIEKMEKLIETYI